MQKLLNIDTNAKTVKGQAYGYMTAILYLLPSAKLCPGSSSGCLATCLNTAGHGGLNIVQDARRKKTKHFITDPQAFMNQLSLEIIKFIAQAQRKNLIPVVRLNGTSDIDWAEHTIAGHNLFDIFEDIQFYDYTKVLSRLQKSKAYPNYHLTFSRSENNTDQCFDAIAQGFNVGVVASKEYQPQLLSMGHIDGDKHDLRFLDDKDKSGLGQLVILKAKGRARKKDHNRFVMTSDDQRHFIWLMTKTQV